MIPEENASDAMLVYYWKVPYHTSTVTSEKHPLKLAVSLVFVLEEHAERIGGNWIGQDLDKFQDDIMHPFFTTPFGKWIAHTLNSYPTRLYNSLFAFSHHFIYLIP